MVQGFFFFDGQAISINPLFDDPNAVAALFRDGMDHIHAAFGRLGVPFAWTCSKVVAIENIDQPAAGVFHPQLDDFFDTVPMNGELIIERIRECDQSSLDIDFSIILREVQNNGVLQGSKVAVGIEFEHISDVIRGQRKR